MMQALASLDDGARRRIISTAALLTSPVDGERLAASRGLERLLAGHGLGIVDVLKAALEQSPAPVRPISTTHHAMAQMCLAQGCLTDWERQFLRSILWRTRLSPKQSKTLDRIVDQIERRKRGAYAAQ